MQILHHPDPSLSQSALPVDDFQGLKELVDQMIELMHAGEGIGLAAPQVGDLRRVVIIDPTGGADASALRVMVNPFIEYSSPEKLLGGEGCLSLPGVNIIVSRSSLINVKYQTIEGVPTSDLLSGLEARIAQHEIDHINGITLMKYVTKSNYTRKRRK